MSNREQVVCKTMEEMLAFFNDKGGYVFKVVRMDGGPMDTAKYSGPVNHILREGPCMRVWAGTSRLPTGDGTLYKLDGSRCSGSEDRRLVVTRAHAATTARRCESMVMASDLAGVGHASLAAAGRAGEQPTKTAEPRKLPSAGLRTYHFEGRYRGIGFNGN